MINAREQVRGKLETICDNVKMSRPDGKVVLPLICYAQTADDIVDVGHERLKWRVTAYCSTFEDLVEMIKEIDAVMHDDLGYTRTRMTPDDETKKGVDFYMSRLDYSALVNLEIKGVIKNSV